MKKKNLLTLGALCLSLGLVVSSCNQTTPGTPGEPGKPGEDGQPGKDGADGKTYKDVIVINDDSIDGGTVTQDVYFVTEGEHDSVTFTFVPENKKDNIVIDFEINGKIVEDLDPAAGSYTLTDADTIDGSIQVTGATFTSVDAYGPLLLERHVEELNKNDVALSLEKLKPVEGDVDNTLIGAANVKTNAYSADATAAVQEAWSEANDDVLEAIEKAKTDHKDDVKAQVEAIKTAAETGIEAIDSAYEQAVKDAIVQAKSDLEDLADEVDHDSYKEENAKTDLDSFTAKIDAATTISGLGSIINGTSLDQDTQGSEANLFYGAKALAFKEVDDALSKLEEAGLSNELDPETASGKALIETLKAYGVDTSKLPEEVAKEQYALISASTDVKVVQDSTTKQYYTELGKAGAEAVEDSVLGIKDTIVAAVKDKYTKEINDSKVLADQTATKTALLGVLETAIQNYVTADTNDTRFSISQYVSTEVNIGTDGKGGTNAQIVPETKAIKADEGATFKNKLGLIGYVEYCLNQPVNGSTNQAWLTERISNAKATVGEQLKTAREAIKDSTYDELTSYTSKTVSGTTYYYPEVSVIIEGTDGKVLPGDKYEWLDVDNPFFNNYSSATEGNEKGSASLVSYGGTGDNAIVPATIGNSTTPINPTYNLDSWLDTLSKANVTKENAKSDYDKDGVWTGGTLYVESWVNGHRSDFQKIYLDGLNKLKGDFKEDATGSTGLSSTVKSAIVNSGLENKDGDYITTSKLSEIWKNYVVNDPTSTNFADANTLVSTAKGMKTSSKILAQANEKILDWIAKFEGTDDDFIGYFGEPSETDSSSLARKAFEDEVKAIIAGEVNSSQLNSWFNRLDSVYTQDVSDFLESAKRYIQDFKTQTVASVGVSKESAINEVYNKYVSFIGHKVKEDSTGNLVIDDSTKGNIDYTCKTISNINVWVDHAKNKITRASLDNPTSVGEGAAVLTISSPKVTYSILDKQGKENSALNALIDKLLETYVGADKTFTINEKDNKTEINISKDNYNTIKNNLSLFSEATVTLEAKLNSGLDVTPLIKSISVLNQDKESVSGLSVSVNGSTLRITLDLLKVKLESQTIDLSVSTYDPANGSRTFTKQIKITVTTE